MPGVDLTVQLMQRDFLIQIISNEHTFPQAISDKCFIFIFMYQYESFCRIRGL